MIDFKRPETKPLEGVVTLDDLAGIGPVKRISVGWHAVYRAMGEHEGYTAEKINDRQYRILSHCTIGRPESREPIRAYPHSSGLIISPA